MSKKASNYVLYGFLKDNPDVVGYFGKKLDIVDDIEDALLFPARKKKGQIGFGKPKQWLELVNEDNDLNKGFKFHLVSIN